MQRLEQLARAAVGFDATRGDQVVIENVSFSSNAPEANPVGMAKVMDETDGLLHAQPGLLKTVCFAALSLLLVLTVVKPMSRHMMTALSQTLRRTAAGFGRRHRRKQGRGYEDLRAPGGPGWAEFRVAASGRTIRREFMSRFRSRFAGAGAEHAAAGVVDQRAGGGGGLMATAAMLAQQREPFPGMGFESTGIPGLRKAAILMVAVGDELAKVFLKSLSIGDVQQVTDEITRLGEVPQAQLTQVLTEFYGLLETEQYMVRGGPDYASRLLTQAFGQERAAEMLLEVQGVREKTHGDLAMLQKMDPHQLSKFLENEHPQTVALVLAHLDPKRGSTLLMHLDAEAAGGDGAAAGGDAAVLAGDGAEGGRDPAPAAWSRWDRPGAGRMRDSRRWRIC